MKQQTPAVTVGQCPGFVHDGKPMQRNEVQVTMNDVAPWQASLAALEPYVPATGNSPKRPERTLNDFKLCTR